MDSPTKYRGRPVPSVKALDRIRQGRGLNAQLNWHLRVLKQDGQYVGQLRFDRRLYSTEPQETERAANEELAALKARLLESKRLRSAHR